MQSQPNQSPNKATKSKGKGTTLTKAQGQLLYMVFLISILQVITFLFFGTGDETTCATGGICYKPGEEWLEIQVAITIVMNCVAFFLIKPDKE